MQEQRRELIREQLIETPERSDRQIAKDLGVSDKTVGVQRKELESGAEIPHVETTIGSDGKEYPRQVQRKPVSVFNPTPREEKAVKPLTPIFGEVTNISFFGDFNERYCCRWTRSARTATGRTSNITNDL